MKKIIALTGPSGVGKTTLANNLRNELGILTPPHCTTRKRRFDDEEGFYKYLSHEEYYNLHKNNLFLISSGDHEIIKKENGNFYGVLQEDCEDLFKKQDEIILFISYKDIENIISKKNDAMSYDVKIINLKYHNIDKIMRTRLMNRNTNTEEQIQNRINSAILYEKEFGELTKKYCDIIYTDEINENETLEKTIKLLKKW